MFIIPHQPATAPAVTHARHSQPSASAQWEAPCHISRRILQPPAPAWGGKGSAKDSLAQMLTALLQCLLIPEARGHTSFPLAQAAPHTQPVLPQWKPARAHTGFIGFHTLANSYQVCDLPLQASAGEHSKAGRNEECLQSGTAPGPPAATPSLQFDPTGPVCKAAITSGSQ